MDKRLIAYVLFIGFLVLVVMPAVHAEDTVEWYVKGKNAAIIGDYEKAIQYYDNALTLDKKYASAYTGKAIALNGLNQYSEAIAAADAALALRKDPDAMNARAYALHALSRDEEAVQAYDLYFTYEINLADAYCNQGKSYIRLNEKEKAITAFDRCTYLNPTGIDGWNQKGLAFISLGRYEDALEAFSQCTRLTTADAEIWNNKGLAYAGLEDYPKALEAFKRAVNIDPSYAEAQANLDKAYLRQPFFTPAVTQSPAITVTATGIQTTVVTTPSPVTPAMTATTLTPAPVQTPEESLTTVKTTHAPLSPFLGIISLVLVVLAAVIAHGKKNNDGFL